MRRSVLVPAVLAVGVLPPPLSLAGNGRAAPVTIIRGVYLPLVAQENE